MTHESLKVKIMVMDKNESLMNRLDAMAQALHSVLELHKPFEDNTCQGCWNTDYGDNDPYPCETIKVIEAALND